MILLEKLKFDKTVSRVRKLRITILENMNYTGIFMVKEAAQENGYGNRLRFCLQLSLRCITISICSRVNRQEKFCLFSLHFNVNRNGGKKCIHLIAEYDSVRLTRTAI